VVASLLSNALALSRRSDGDARFIGQAAGGQEGLPDSLKKKSRASKLSQISRFSASEFIERSVEQIKLICQDKSPGIYLLAAQKALMLSVSVIVTPMIALAACFFIAASLSDVLGDPLRSLLVKGFRPFQLAAVFVFFGPVWVGLCCVATSWMGNDDGGGASGSNCRCLCRYLSAASCVKGGISKAPLWSQVAAYLATSMAGLFVVIIFMLLEERLLKHTIIDEVILVIIWGLWTAMMTKTTLFHSCNERTRDKQMLYGLQVAMIVAALWLISRGCVELIFHRRSASRAYEVTCSWLLVLIAVRDLLVSCIHILLRVRMRRNFLAFSCEEHKEQAMRGVFENIGDIYYNIESQMASSAASSASSASSSLRSLSSKTFHSELIEHLAKLMRSWRTLTPKEQIDPFLLEQTPDCSMPYVLVTVSASGPLCHDDGFLKSPLQICGDEPLPALDPAYSSSSSSSFPFLLSPKFCGSSRAGYFATPASLTISETLYLSSGREFFNDSRGRMKGPSGSQLACSSTGITGCVCGQIWLQAGGWLQLPAREAMKAQGRGAGSPSRGSAHHRDILISGSPTPNFFLDTNGNRPIVREEISLRARCLQFLANQLNSKRFQCSLLLLSISTLVSILHPALLLVVVTIALIVVVVSLLPEGRTLLQHSYLLLLHKLLRDLFLGRPTSSLLFVSDEDQVDQLGLFELLRRRCSLIVVLDSTVDEKFGASPPGDVEQADPCWAFLKVVERARRELGCAFLPPRDHEGDIWTVVRDFHRNPHARTLRLKVHYMSLAAAGGASPTSLSDVSRSLQMKVEEEKQSSKGKDVVVKEGYIILLKSRWTPADSDLLPQEQAFNRPSCTRINPILLPGGGAYRRRMDSQQKLEELMQRIKIVYEQAKQGCRRMLLGNSWSPEGSVFGEANFDALFKLGKRATASIVDDLQEQLVVSKRSTSPQQEEGWEKGSTSTSSVPFTLSEEAGVRNLSGFSFVEVPEEEAVKDGVVQA